MTRTPMPLFDTSLLGPFALWVNNHFGKVINEQFMIIMVLVSCSTAQRCMQGRGGPFPSDCLTFFCFPPPSAHLSSLPLFLSPHLAFSLLPLSPCIELSDLHFSSPNLHPPFHFYLPTYLPFSNDLCHSCAQIFLLTDLFSHAIIGCRQICRYFNISCFTIPYPPPEVAPNAATSKRSNGSETLQTSEATSPARSKGDT